MKDIQVRINTLEDKDKKNDTEMDKMKIQLDDIQQKEKDRNIIVTGLTDGQLDKEKAIEVLNEKLGTGIRTNDIEYLLQLKTRENQPNRLRIVFCDKNKKNEIMKQKTKLKNISDIWFSDELTKYRSELAYAARQAVKEKNIHQTWVYDSKIFVKRSENDRPTSIRYKDDIHK
jgi:hypothetical protein